MTIVICVLIALYAMLFFPYHIRMQRYFNALINGEKRIKELEEQASKESQYTSVNAQLKHINELKDFVKESRKKYYARKKPRTLLNKVQYYLFLEFFAVDK